MPRHKPLTIKETCDMFYDDDTINPKTGNHIAKNSKVYNSIKSKCDKKKKKHAECPSSAKGACRRIAKEMKTGASKVTNPFSCKKIRNSDKHSGTLGKIDDHCKLSHNFNIRSNTKHARVHSDSDSDAHYSSSPPRSSIKYPIGDTLRIPSVDDGVSDIDSDSDFDSVVSKDDVYFTDNDFNNFVDTLELGEDEDDDDSPSTAKSQTTKSKISFDYDSDDSLFLKSPKSSPPKIVVTKSSPKSPKRYVVKNSKKSSSPPPTSSDVSLISTPKSSSSSDVSLILSTPKSSKMSPIYGEDERRKALEDEKERARKQREEEYEKTRAAYFSEEEERIKLNDERRRELQRQHDENIQKMDAELNDYRMQMQQQIHDQRLKLMEQMRNDEREFAAEVQAIIDKNKNDQVQRKVDLDNIRREKESELNKLQLTTRLEKERLEREIQTIRNTSNGELQKLKDEYASITSDLQLQITDLKEKIANQEKGTDEDKLALQRQLAEYEQQRAKLQEEISLKKKAAEDEHKKAMENIAKQRAEMDMTYNSNRALLAKEIGQLERQSQTAARNVKDMRLKKELAEKSLAEINADLEKLKAINIDNISRIAAVTEELKNAQGSRDEIVGQIATIVASVDALRTQRVNLEKERAEWQVSQSELEREIVKLANENTVLKTQMQNLTILRNALISQKQELEKYYDDSIIKNEQLQTEITNLKNSISDLETTISNMEKDIKYHDHIAERTKSLIDKKKHVEDKDQQLVVYNDDDEDKQIVPYKNDKLVQEDEIHVEQTSDDETQEDIDKYFIPANEGLLRIIPLEWYAETDPKIAK
jgi:hypothetical protein